VIRIAATWPAAFTTAVAVAPLPPPPVMVTAGGLLLE
jgi:hypothetical protein